MLQPGKGVEDFTRDILRPFIEAKPTKGKRTTVEIPYFNGGWHENNAALMEQLVKGVVYVAEAYAAEAEGDVVNAWRSIGIALHCVGFLDGLMIIKPSVEHAHSKRSKAGGSTRAENMGFNKVKEHALQLVELHGHKYHTRNQAATALAGQVFEFAKKSNVVMSEDNMVNKLNGWFKHLKFEKKKQLPS